MYKQELALNNLQSLLCPKTQGKKNRQIFVIMVVLGSIPGRVIPKTLKMELDTTLLNTQYYKVRFKGKVEQSWEWSSALPYTLV